MPTEMNTRLNPEVGAQDLASCNDEPLSQIAAVQARGCFFAIDPITGRVTNASANADLLVHRPATEIAGLHLHELFASRDVERITTEIGGPEWRMSQRRHFLVDGRVAFAYRVGELVALEVELMRPRVETSPVDRLELIRDAVAKIKIDPDAARVLCRTVREITSMDRVMLYKFHRPSWHGEVIAEDKVAEAHGFMSHFFPASDIPRPARDLYLRNRLRYIDDIDAGSAPLIPPVNPRTGKLFDLSDSRVRAVSPIHIEYLRNMGVRSSLSIAIVVDDELWGLIACHGLTTKIIDERARAECEVLAESYAVRVRWEEDDLRHREHLELHRALREIALTLSQSQQPERDLLRHHRVLETAFNAGGVALVSGKDVDLAGLTPTSDEVTALAKLFFARMDEMNVDHLALEHLRAIENVPETLNPEASGALCLRVPHIHDSCLLLFRPEVVRTIRWGGDPRKQLQKRDYQGRINPRLSFDSWTETIRAESLPWRDFEVDAAREFRDLVFLGFARHARLLRELS